MKVQKDILIKTIVNIEDKKILKIINKFIDGVLSKKVDV